MNRTKIQLGLNTLKFKTTRLFQSCFVCCALVCNVWISGNTSSVNGGSYESISEYWRFIWKYSMEVWSYASLYDRLYFGIIMCFSIVYHTFSLTYAS